ncbi:hypothetical protein KIPB_008539 [Kipferlia bialata]|uniref:Uncharacterized protein n=1 Tax=Kipferlia bialata TaxID=797122 RepID=A0A391NR10_9EUKA|nr:hypothetical protein KIPB_008539 [Kipferlia bialata]|eukprot:g8539.t1
METDTITLTVTHTSPRHCLRDAKLSEAAAHKLREVLSEKGWGEGEIPISLHASVTLSAAIPDATCPSAAEVGVGLDRVKRKDETYESPVTYELSLNGVFVEHLSPVVITHPARVYIDYY